MYHSFFKLSYNSLNINELKSKKVIENLRKELLKNRENYKNFAINRSKIINDSVARSLRTIRNRNEKPFSFTDNIDFHKDY